MLATSTPPNLAAECSQPQAPELNSGERLTQTDLIDSFAHFLNVDVASGDASNDTIKNYACQTKKYFQWCDCEGIAPIKATRDDVKKYRRWLVEVKQYKPATIAFKLIVVRRLYAAAVERGLILVNPAIGVHPPRECRDPAERITYLEQPEVPHLLSAIPTDKSVASLRDRLLVAVMMLEGCRTVEMHRLSIFDIIRRGQNVGLRVKGKRSLRIVPLTADLVKLLELYLEARLLADHELTPDTPMFISMARNNRGHRLTRRSIQRIVDKYLKATNLKHNPGRTLSAHSLRHTAGTLALRTGSDLRQVQDLLGHADPRTTAIYAHVGDRWKNNPALRFGVPLF
ncbi:MAG: tyrosine-type recombinase/integrase [Waterburya sp.]